MVVLGAWLTGAYGIPLTMMVFVAGVVLAGTGAGVLDVDVWGLLVLWLPQADFPAVAC